jgi:glycerol-1-phosphate dehydrogenase [NAD(P)+]
MSLINSRTKNIDIYTYFGSDAIDTFAEHVVGKMYHQVVLVADENTHCACGSDLEIALTEKDLNIQTVVLLGDSNHVTANARSVLDVLIALQPDTSILVAIGSGTITDIVRFVSLKTKLPFICIPTAASVDAYTSNTTSITVKGIKKSFQGVQPEAIFMHPETLKKAPKKMTSAGFGDMLAKYTATADWKLAHLLVDETYDEQLVQFVMTALQQCVDNVLEIGACTENGIRVLMDSLNVSGLCMVRAMKSRPASGSEHSLSHFWEMTHQKGDTHLALHGTRTGVATGVIADLFECIRNLSRDEAAKRITNANYPNPTSEKAGLQRTFGNVGREIGDSRYSFLGMNHADYKQLKKRILDHWEEIVRIASKVPTREQISSLLKRANGVSMPQEIGISGEKVRQSLRWASYLRPRFTVLELTHILNLFDKQRSLL